MTHLDRRIFPLCALAGFAGCAFGLAIDAKAMLASYLAVWLAISAIPIGAIAALLTSYLVRAGWTRDLYSPLSAAVLTMPAVAVLFLPVLFGMHEIYPWAFDPGALPAFKATYLAPWFFVLRAVMYFAIWTALALWAVQAYGRDAAMIRSASAGLIVWSLTASFAGIDWMESIEPDFHSSIYGLLAVTFDLLGGLGFAIVAVIGGGRPRQMSNASYSAVLFSVILLWAYLHAMQYIIIWSGNLPDEVIWYLKRLDGGWRFALWGLFVAQFVVPFFILLAARMRSSTRALFWLAGVTVALRVLEACVLILPPHMSGSPLLLDLPAAILAVGSCWLAAWRAAGALHERRSGRTAAAH